MVFVNTAKELLKYGAMRVAPGLLRWHHRALGNAARRYMDETLVPAVAALRPGRVLFVGCTSYTYRYRQAFLGHGADYWTTDIDPAARVWGEGRKHIVCDVRQIDRLVAAGSFDMVLLNGVFGYGVNDAAAMTETLEAINRILKSGGVLLVGWNRDRIADPETLPAFSRLYSRASIGGLPARVQFPDHSHVYDMVTSSQG